MPKSVRRIRLVAMSLAAIAVSACTSTYTGPVEVTRFVSEQPAALGQGTIALTFPEEVSNEAARAAFREAVGNELIKLGYTLSGSPSGGQEAIIRTTRNGIESIERRSPVSVGVGGGTGTFGTGGGVGIGINLGGSARPSIVTDLEVRISDASGQALWEGRAQIATSVKSPHSAVDVSARTLAGALFKDFPGGNGETVTIDVDEIQGTE